MDLKKELEKHNLSAYRFSLESEIPYMTIWRWLHGGRISPIYRKYVKEFFEEKVKKDLQSL